MGENHFTAGPSALYGAILFLAAVAYYILQSLILADLGPASKLSEAIGCDLKGRLSPVLYLLGVGLSFWKPWLGNALYVAVALMWLVPDRRLEKALHPDDAA